MIIKNQEKQVKFKNKENIKYLFKSHTDNVKCLVALNENFLISGSWDTNIFLWDLRNQKKILELTGHSWFVTQLKISIDCKYLASSSNDNSIIIWDIENEFEKLFHLKHNDDSISIVSLEWLPNGDIISGSWNNIISVWNLKKQKIIFNLIGHQNTILSLVSFNNGQNLASSSSDKSIIIWDLLEKKNVINLKNLHTSCINSLVVLNDDKLLASGSSDSTIVILDLINYTVKMRLIGHDGYVLSLTVLSNGDLVSASWDKTIIIWNINDGSIKRKLHGHDDSIWSVCSVKNNYIASGSKDNSIIIWDPFPNN